MGMLNLGLSVPDRETLPPDPSGIARGLHPSGVLARTLRLREKAEPGHACASARGSRARTSPRLLNDGSGLDP
jgi:hypothetical protein